MSSTKSKLFLTLLLGLSILCGCSEKLTKAKITLFANDLDKAEQNRDAEAMCRVRSEQFFEDQLVIRSGHAFPMHRATKQEFCREATKILTLVAEYSFKRLSQEITVSEDHTSAVIRAVYVRKIPQIVSPERIDRATIERESLVALENGALVIKSSKAKYAIEEINRTDDPFP